MSWQKGPLPPKTYGWGGVTLKKWGENPPGFYFADFCGDHVKVIGSGSSPTRVEPEDVGYYDNSITLPPGGRGRLMSDPAVQGAAEKGADVQYYGPTS